MKINKVSKELAFHRLEQAKEDLGASKILYIDKYYKSSNNRAYYAVFHAIRAVLSLEPIDFKRHKNVIAYFNEHYVNKEIFPREMGRKIAKCSKLREDSDYDDEFIVKPEITLEQIEIAKNLIEMVEKYINNKLMKESQEDFHKNIN